jgi:hypothetical protein
MRVLSLNLDGNKRIEVHKNRVDKREYEFSLEIVRENGSGGHITAVCALSASEARALKAVL